MSLWCLRVDGDGFVVLIKRGERMRAEGNYKEGNRPYVHRLITLRNGIGNAIHCQSIIIASLSYDVIDNVLSRDGHEALIAMTVCCYKMIIQMSMSMETVRVVHWRCCLSHLSFFDNLPCRNIS